MAVEERRVEVVVATRNRRDTLLRTLRRLESLGERPHIVVVDNGSRDGTADTVARQHPEVATIELDRNAGAAARTLGAHLARAPYVAFCDDDSWWRPGALSAAADVLDANPDVAVVAAQVRVGPEERVDPACARMAASPLGPSDGAGRPYVLGFVASGAVVRRDAFLAIGGFSDETTIGGEEELVALDLAARGWTLVYDEDVVAHHHPSALRDRDRRRRYVLRNRLRTAWLRRPFRVALRETGTVLRLAAGDRAARRALADVAAEAVAIAGRRHVVPSDVERQLATVRG